MSQDQPFALKVLRLARPTLQTTPIVEGPSLPSTTAAFARSTNVCYVGERASFLIAVDNTAAVPLRAALDVDVLAPDQQLRCNLVAEEGAGALREIPSAESWPTVVGFEPDAPGVYTLRVVVSYGADPLQSHRRLFKFEAVPAVAVRTKVTVCGNTQCAVEAQIENVSASALALVSCCLAAHDAEHSAQPARNPLLLPRDVFQYCFLVDRQSDRTTPARATLSVAWRREPLGAKGKLTSPPIRI